MSLTNRSKSPELKYNGSVKSTINDIYRKKKREIESTSGSIKNFIEVEIVAKKNKIQSYSMMS